MTNVFGASINIRDSIEAVESITTSGDFITKTKYVEKTGDTMTGDLFVEQNGTDLGRILGCSDVTVGKFFKLLLGNFSNRIEYNFGSSINLNCDLGVDINIVQTLKTRFRNNLISFYTDIDMYSNRIRGVNYPILSGDAVNKYYVDKFGTVTLDFTKLLPYMTSNNTPTPYITSASSILSTDYDAWKAFDSSANTEWASLGDTPAWVQIQSTDYITVYGVIIKGRWNTGQFSTWDISGSNDGLSFSIIYQSITTVSISSTVIEFTAKYKYLRFNGLTGAINAGLSRVIFVTESFLDLKNKRIVNVAAPTGSNDAVNKSYIDTLLPAVTSTNNDSFLQVRDGKWDISTINGITISDLNDCSKMKSGCVYTFNNGTVTNPIPYGGNSKYAMIAISNGNYQGGVDDAWFLACSITTIPRVFIHTKVFNSSAGVWAQIAGGGGMTNALDMGNQFIKNIKYPFNDNDAANKYYVDKIGSTILDTNSILPFMTSNTTPAPYSTSASSILSTSYDAWHAFDSSNIIEWKCLGSTTSWVQIQSTKVMFIYGVIIRGGFGTDQFSTWNISGSNDGSTFNTLYASDIPLNYEELYIEFNKEGSILYKFLRFTGIPGSANPGLTNLRFITNRVLHMQYKRIIGVSAPINNYDATNKSYVDSRLIKSHHGYIPLLEANDSITGFIASGSPVTNSNYKYQPYGAFNSLNEDGKNGSWATQGSITGSLKIQCPEAVKIWKFAVKPLSVVDITTWSLYASSDGIILYTIYSGGPTLLGNSTAPYFFEIPKMGYYKYFVLDVESSTGTGVELFQLYIYSEIL